MPELRQKNHTFVPDNHLHLLSKRISKQDRTHKKTYHIYSSISFATEWTRVLQLGHNDMWNGKFHDT